MDELWDLEALVHASGGVLDGTPTSRIVGFSIDTRSLVPGEVFVALKDQRDGHAFVTQAFAKGAAAALVETAYQRAAGDGALIRVPDVLKALESIGRAARARLSDGARVVAVTGSAGKTGTKEMLRACFKACASSPERVHAADKSFNNHWGVPLTLARMPASTELAVFEIGMNHAGEITPLSQMVRPHVAIITNVLPVHVGNFADGEIGIANAKAEIFAGLEPGGVAVLLRDSPHFDRLSVAATRAGARIVTFGEAPQSDWGLVDVANQGDPQSVGQTVKVAISGAAPLAFAMGMQGRHLATNALAVLAAVRAAGGDLAKAMEALREAGAVQGRGQRIALAVPGGEILLLDESYNANPASVAAALALLGQVPISGRRRRIAVLGDMLELGDQATAYHMGLLGPLSAAKCDLLFACGPEMKHLFDLVPIEKRGAWQANSAELTPILLDALRPGDVVMVKGSFGSRMGPVVDAIKNRFTPLGARV